MATYKYALFFCALSTVTAVAQSEGHCLTDYYATDQSYDTFEVKVRESLKTIKNDFAKDNAALPTETVPIIREGLAVQSDWNLKFAKTILEHSLSESKRNSAESFVSLIQAKLDTVLTKMKQLNDSNLSDSDRNSVVHILDTTLVELVNIFKKDENIFREYPLLANKALMSLGVYVPMFRRFEKAASPEMFNTSQLACNLQETLRQYGYLVTRARLEYMDLPNKTVGELKFHFWADCFPEEIPFENCKNKYDACKSNVDTVRNQYKLYEEIINVVKETCFTQPRLSGYGWIMVEMGELVSSTSLNPTFKVIVDDVKEFDKPLGNLWLDYQNRLVYKSKKIPSAAKIVLEVWTEDGKRIFSHEPEFQNKYYQLDNKSEKFAYSTFWIPEYVYD